MAEIDCDSCLKDPLPAYLTIWDAKCKPWNGAFDHDCQLHWHERCIEARNFPLVVSFEDVSRADSILGLHLPHYNPLMAVYSHRPWTGPGTVGAKGRLEEGALGDAFKGYILSYPLPILALLPAHYNWPYFVTHSHSHEQKWILPSFLGFLCINLDFHFSPTFDVASSSNLSLSVDFGFMESRYYISFLGSLALRKEPTILLTLHITGSKNTLFGQELTHEWFLWVNGELAALLSRKHLLRGLIGRLCRQISSQDEKWLPTSSYYPIMTISSPQRVYPYWQESCKCFSPGWKMGPKVLSLHQLPPPSSTWALSEDIPNMCRLLGGN